MASVAFRKLPPDSATRWPGGPRTLACLRCNKPFRSQGKGHRLCTLCQLANAGDDAPPYSGVLHARSLRPLEE